MKIAVLLDGEGNTSGFETDGIIHIFVKKKGEWFIEDTMNFGLSEISDATALHKKMQEISMWLDSCRIMIVNRIRGIHYLALEQYQISMMEIPGTPFTFLDDLEECISHERNEQVVPLEHNAIRELTKGHFYTDLRDIMGGILQFKADSVTIS